MKAKPESARTPRTRSPRGGAPRVASRVTPDALFELATAKWLRGERLELAQLASELGVARATVFRWVGTREQLYGEVVSGEYARLRERIVRTTHGRGVERVVEVARRNLEGLSKSKPLRQFIAQDPELAIRVLTAKASPVHARSVEHTATFLRDALGEAKIEPVLDLATLAFTVIRIGEAFLYADVISGRKPEIDKAVAAIRILVAADSKVHGKARRTRAPARTVRSR